MTFKGKPRSDCGIPSPSLHFSLKKCFNLQNYKLAGGILLDVALSNLQIKVGLLPMLDQLSHGRVCLSLDNLCERRLCNLFWIFLQVTLFKERFEMKWLMNLYKIIGKGCYRSHLAIVPRFGFWYCTLSDEMQRP